jgi:hypothetical protein
VDTEDVKNLIRYYEEENGDYLTVQDYMQKFVSSYSLHSEGMPPEKKIFILLSYIRTTHNPTGLGIYQAFKRNDMSMLNDVIYQSASIEQITNIFAVGSDHSYFSSHTLPEILAGNCADRIPLLIPEKFGISKNGHRVSKAKMNLFMALWYRSDELIDGARKSCDDVLKTKLSSADRACICYLMSLLNEDADAASRYLELFCAGKKKSQNFGETKFTRAFCIEAHALFNLAHYVKNGELEDRIKMPEQSNFSQDLARQQKSSGYSHGSLFLKYPRPLDMLNILLSMTPPANSLFKPYKNEKGRGSSDWYIDTDSFKKSVIGSAAEICGANA